MTKRSGRYFLRLRCAALAIAALLTVLALLPNAETLSPTATVNVPSVVDIRGENDDRG